MATEVSEKHYTLNEKQAQKILNAPKFVLKENTTSNDINFTREKRIANAAEILNARKCK